MNRLRNSLRRGVSTVTKSQQTVSPNHMHEGSNQNTSRGFGIKKSLFLLGLSYGVYKFYVRQDDIFSAFTRGVGIFCHIKFPSFILMPMLRKYCSFYDLDLSDYQIQNLEEFDSINSFFIRKLKPGARTIERKDDPSSICSPCDGTVSFFGDCKDNSQMVIKGVTYTVQDFLFGKHEDNKQQFTQILEKVNERGNELKYCLIYLSPGNYHRFHSPTK